MSLKTLLKSPDQSLLVTPRYEQYLDSPQHRNLLFQTELFEEVAKEVTEPQRNRRSTFSASSTGSCPRAQVFQFTPIQPVDRFPTSLIAVFHQGTFTHMKWQAILLDAGVLDDVEVSCTLDKYRLSGTIDGVGTVPHGHQLASHGQYGWEFKTIRDNGFRWVLDRGVSKAHLLQVHAYMLMTGMDLWSVVYENKDTQEWKEFIVHRDPAITETVENLLRIMNEHIDNRTLPPILTECENRQGAYKTCPFAHECLETHSWPGEPKRRIRI